MRPLTVAVPALAAAAALAVPAAAAPPSTLHLYSKTLASSLYDASGAAVQRDPVFTATATDYRGTKAKHSKARVGSDHISCTILSTETAQALCDGQIALKGGMIVSDRAKVTLSDAVSVYPVTGGTGRYAKVKGGTITATGDGEDITIKLRY
jgi:hypothetical protein